MHSAVIIRAEKIHHLWRIFPAGSFDWIYHSNCPKIRGKEPFDDADGLIRLDFIGVI